MVFPIVVIALFALSCWALFVTYRRLRRSHASRFWWFAFSVLTLAGVFGGYWVATHLEYQVSPTFRLYSFPIPVCIFHLEHGRWVDFPLDRTAMYSGIAANIVAITALAVMPVLVASLFLHRRQSA